MSGEQENTEKWGRDPNTRQAIRLKNQKDPF